VPIIPGHEIVGRVEAIGQAVGHVALGERVGVPWLGYTCGVCPYCLSGQFIASYRSLDRSHQQAGFGSS
jgi:propanol-preferring alcohol dehydrogenase